jgi:hypothetical protein
MWIFLDIDGVLVPERKFAQALDRADLLRFDRDCLQAFENVVRRYPAVSVVISSSWREVFSFSAIRSRFSTDIAERVVICTPFLSPDVIYEFR